MAISLDSLRRGKQLAAPRIFLYSSHGVGKSTLGASCPDPVFVATEDGLGNLDVTSFPLATKVQDVIDATSVLLTETHEFKTVVLDSVDWLENMLVKEIEAGYEAKDLAFGKHALFLADAWRNILSGFYRLRNEKNMIVLLLGHCEIKRFDSPEVSPFERYQPKLQARSSALVQEWCDCVLFANYKTLVHQADVGFNQKVTRGISTGERVMYTSEKPAYLAKNRYSLPSELPLSWQALSDAITHAST